VMQTNGRIKRVQGARKGGLSPLFAPGLTPWLYRVRYAMFQYA